MRLCTILLASLLLMGGVTGCSTIFPTYTPSNQASFDGEVQNSGVIGVYPAVGESKGFQVTSRFVERYNAMIDLYGDDPSFTPPLVRNSGVTPLPDGSALMTPEAMTHFIKLNTWRKNKKEPIGGWEKFLKKIGL